MACLLLHLGVSNFLLCFSVPFFVYCNHLLVNPRNWILIFILVTEQKEKLSEVEQQLKRAEALQRRRMQVEKAARESEV